MLRPTILTFVNVYFVDSLPLLVGAQAAIFLLEFFYGHALWWPMLIEFPIGAALALTGRWLQARLADFFLLWPRRRRTTLGDLIWRCVVALAIAAIMLAYNQRLHKPVETLQTPFSVGLFLSVAGTVVLLLCVECLGYVLERRECTFKLLALYPLCAIAIVGIALFDLFVFLGGYQVALIFLGLLAAFCVGGVLFGWIVTPPAPFR